MQQRNPVVTFLTDFGLQDTFVGQMKGVVLSRCPGATLVDLTHGIAPQAVVQGVYHLSASWHWFPAGSIHVCVVDPGVGTNRRAVAISAAGHLFLAPDNGLLSGVLRDYAPDFAVDLSQGDLVPEHVSRTFHGRDVFAHAAGHLAAGAELSEVGSAFDPSELLRLELPDPVVTDERIVGEIVMIDHWGNAVSNVPAGLLDGPDSNWRVECGDLAIEALSSTYGAVEQGEPLAVISSMDTVEIAVRDGSAASRYDLQTGMMIALSRQQ